MVVTKRQSRRVTIEEDHVTAAAAPQSSTHFPYKLYDMLEYAADSKYSSAVSWSDDGTQFSIHDKDMLMKHVVPMFFKQSKFRSFVSRCCAHLVSLSIAIIIIISYDATVVIYHVYPSSIYSSYLSIFLLSCTITYRHGSSIYGGSHVIHNLDHGNMKILSAAVLNLFKTSNGLKSKVRLLPPPRRKQV